MVAGRSRQMPPSSVIRRLPPEAWITAPVPMNKRALYRMWLNAWALDPLTARSVPRPTPQTM